jgi:N-acetylmuramoyl-L-alanine amidase
LHKYKTVFLLSVLLVLAFITTYVLHKFSYNLEVMSQPHKNKIIIIDPGHGGIDPGATGSSGTAEKDINLKIAKKLKSQIQQGGGIALLTREKDVGLYDEGKSSLAAKKRQDLKRRIEMAVSNKADLFISIHLNGHPSGRWYGAQTFYNGKCQESRGLAEIIQGEMVRVLDPNNHRKAKHASGYYILDTAYNHDIPAVIVEVGFLTNAREEGLLKTPEYQDKAAWAIYLGIMRYLSEG